VNQGYDRQRAIWCVVSGGHAVGMAAKLTTGIISPTPG
jgi:hypothetical protein